MDVTQHSSRTPISNTKISSIDAASWQNPNTTIDQLYDQLSLMQQRLIAAQQCGAIQAIQGIQSGINQINQIIQRRLETQETDNDLRK